MRSRGVVAVEMEAPALFYLAMREQGRGNDVRGACILTVSDTLTKDEDAVRPATTCRLMIWRPRRDG